MNKPRGKSSSIIALLLALSLTASACSSSDALETDGENARATETTTSANDSGDSDAEFATTTAQAFEESEAMEEAIDSSEELAAAPEDGFFGSTTVSPEPDDEDIWVDNTFNDYGVRGFVPTDVDPLSTFALDVDTGSYSVAKAWLNEGSLPPKESVRVEEYVNSFDYDYRAPRDGLNVVADGGPSPFSEDTVILRLGVATEEVRNSERPDASLTFLIDTSGSMDRTDRLELVKESLETLVNELDDEDSVAIVTFSSNSKVVLEPTSVSDSDEIIDAIRSLRPDGSTNLEAGLRSAYSLADDAYLRDGINRVILASDGVANSGVTSSTELSAMIRDDADRGIQLVTLGVGMGNFNDVVMEQLADNGDGFYAYANTIEEAEKIFTDDLVSTLLTVAIDGKIQVEFDEDVVKEYRLIGYENRGVLDNDFRNDEVDAGELGAGHEATALYELELHDGVRNRDTIGTAMVRWEDPETGDVVESRLEIAANVIEDNWGDTDEDFRLAVTVASFAEILRDSPFAEDLTIDQVIAEAKAIGGSGEVTEFEEMVDLAAQLR